MYGLISSAMNDFGVSRMDLILISEDILFVTEEILVILSPVEFSELDIKLAL